MEQRARELRKQIHERVGEVETLTAGLWKDGRTHTSVYDSGMNRLIADYRRSADVQAWLGEGTNLQPIPDEVLVRLLEERLALLDEVLAGWAVLTDNADATG
ncbi:MAG: hypothetical protein K0Q72_327 [Armatimonadetes bacterium]|jgi:hypothetical protein|nr:hypothetical protein [Armatimonadota bacterium]